MATIVQKYGGTSVADAEKIKGVARRIASACHRGDRVVAVVSAMGDTTDRLIELAGQVSSRPESRELDALLSTGEQMSCTLVAMALKSLGLDAVSLSGAQAGIRTDSRYGKARIAAVEAGRIQGELEDGRVVVVAGFQGITEDMDVTTLGRGASDLSAVAVAAAISADRCEVYTDVEGIYTADPRHVPNARKLEEVGYDEMLEMASLGAKMQPRSIELAMAIPGADHGGVQLRRSAGNTHSQGSRYGTEGRGDSQQSARRRHRSQRRKDYRNRHSRPAGHLRKPPRTPRGGRHQRRYSRPERLRQGHDGPRLHVSGDDADRALEIVRTVAYTIGANDVIRTENLAKVSVVGAAMQNTPGYASRMFRALADEGINIEMITTSEIRITCVVDADRVGEAARALHATFASNSRSRPRPDVDLSLCSEEVNVRKCQKMSGHSLPLSGNRPQVLPRFTPDYPLTSRQSCSQ